MTTEKQLCVARDDETYTEGRGVTMSFAPKISKTAYTFKRIVTYAWSGSLSERYHPSISMVITAVYMILATIKCLEVTHRGLQWFPHPGIFRLISSAGCVSVWVVTLDFLCFLHLHQFLINYSRNSQNFRFFHIKRWFFHLQKENKEETLDAHLFPLCPQLTFSHSAWHLAKWEASLFIDFYLWD